RGTLALVYPEAQEGASFDALFSMAHASFRALALAILDGASSGGYSAQGFTGGSGDEAGFASFIFKQLDDSKRQFNGKLHKFGKMGFLK
ncbi:MAG: hypothetical protein FWE09_09600, partial [Treponema sp.]|nr:hypothetical protein [Treponema sp.]